MLLRTTDPFREDPVRIACEPIDTVDHEPSGADTPRQDALVRARQQIDGLEEALRTRTTIGQAVGMLMREKTLTSDEAFAELVELSSHTNVKIRDIASRMVDEASARASAPPSHTE